MVERLYRVNGVSIVGTFIRSPYPLGAAQVHQAIGLFSSVHPGVPKVCDVEIKLTSRFTLPCGRMFT